MTKTRSSNGKKINWINYPSDVKNIYIRIEVDSNGARLCLDIQPKDNEIRALIWEQMTELKFVLENIMDYHTHWIEEYCSEQNKVISRISWEENTLNIYKLDEHFKIYEFLRERLIKFDLFYQEYKEILIALVN
ncbi:MAG: DUF4268 domain-containing protein [Flavobacteriia bacterium]|nr:DUF4268 domain-containing protein [Flavobacteriia bacterium]